MRFIASEPVSIGLCQQFIPEIGARKHISALEIHFSAEGLLFSGWCLRRCAVRQIKSPRSTDGISRVLSNIDAAASPLQKSGKRRK